ncbi:hypothetical protein [Brevundimonas sp.]|uniref:hypothetical protein n=1 Tax=Brevundimonas sp. TaxID=1871086 RepID=UPI003565A8AA
MLKLEATLVATTTARPWRGGWSPDRGVDFIVGAPLRESVAAAPANAERIVAGEPVSFLDADDILAPGMAVIRRYVSLAAQAADASADPPLTRAWSSVARKVPGS